MSGEIAGMVKKQAPAREIVETMMSEAESILKAAPNRIA